MKTSAVSHQSDSDNEPQSEESLDFLFGVRLHLGLATNNYAEYLGLILAQVIHALNGSREITVKSDSQLLVTQVKGIAKVKNIRFTRMMPIIHDLALHFETMNFDWIERKQNLVADMLAKKAATMSVGAKLD